MQTLDDAIKHAREQADKQLKEGNDACAFEHEQLAGWLEEMTRGRTRISELCEMLNKAQEVAKVQVENERDACEKAVQFLLNVADGSEPGTERTGSGERLRALQHAVDVLKSRKDAGVKALHEAAHGSMIGEYVQACVNEGVEREKAKWQAVDAAWRGFWTRGGSSPGELRNRSCGASAWLLEQLSTAFKMIDGERARSSAPPEDRDPP